MTNIYNVYLYREMRLVYHGIEADAPESAASIARDKPTGDADDIDDCDGETFAAVVDVQGDQDYCQSRTVEFEEERLRKAAPALLEALKDLLGDRPDVQDGQCVRCGREYRDPDPDFDIQTGDCPSDDCPAFIARAAIALAEGTLNDQTEDGHDAPDAA
jgi:hypothetical protein